MRFNKFLDFDMFSHLSSIITEDIENICRTVDLNSYRNKTILITGANGHIASYLVYTFAYANEFYKTNIRILANSRNLEKMRQNFEFLFEKKWFQSLICDVADVSSHIEFVDYIFHFAGNASPYFISHDPVGILNANINGTFQMCELAKKSQRCKIIFASTREVYGEVSLVDSISETTFGKLDPMLPRACYPESKRASETIIEAYHKQYGIDYDVIRIAHCYGPGMKLENDGRVMSDLLNFAVKKQDIILNSTGLALRSFLYISDAVTAIIKIASQQGCGVWNLSNETEEISIINLARLISEKIGNIKVLVKPQTDNSTLYTNYRRIPLNCSKLTKIGWFPDMELRSGLDRTLSFFLLKK